MVMRISWGALAIAVLIALAFDLSALVIAVLINYSTHCDNSTCSVAIQLHQSRRGLVFVPIILLVPVIVVLLLRQARMVVILAQALVCAFVLGHNVSNVHHLENVLNGKAQCTAAERTAPGCPR
jgi:hypothetical protein